MEGPHEHRKTSRTKSKNIHETNLANLRSRIVSIQTQLKTTSTPIRERAVKMCYGVDKLVRSLSKLYTDQGRKFEVADTGVQQLKMRLETALAPYLLDDAKTFLDDVDSVLCHGLDSSVLRGYRFAQVMKAAKVRLDESSFERLNTFVHSAKNMSSNAVRSNVTRCEFTTDQRLDQLIALWLGKPYPHNKVVTTKLQERAKKRLRTEIDSPPKTVTEFRARAAKMLYTVAMDPSNVSKFKEILPVFHMEGMEDELWKLYDHCDAQLFI